MARSRSTARQLGLLFAASPHPIYLLDDRRQIAYANQATLSWLGLEEHQILGLRCDYGSSEDRADKNALAAALCPPAEAFVGRRCSGHVMTHGDDGLPRSRRGDFLPLGDVDKDAQSVLALLDLADTPPPLVSPEEETAKQLHQELRALSVRVRGRFRLDRLVGTSPAMQRVRQQVQLAIDGGARVLVVGPPGSGREHVARTIHCGDDPGGAGPLMPLSCSLLEAELLQTTVLAFLRRCNAEKSEAEKTEHPATLLLLDADQLTDAAQAELLAFFHIPTFPLRTIVTAQRPLLELAERKCYSRELAYALSTLVISLPRLTDRRGDIPVLAQQIVEQYNTRGNRQLSGFTEQALDQLGALPWPGNVEELASVVLDACQGAPGPWIGEGDLPQRVQMVHSAAAHPPPEEETIVLDELLGRIESELIGRAMRHARGNKAQAARLLGIPRARLLRRLAQRDGD